MHDRRNIRHPVLDHEDGNLVNQLEKDEFAAERRVQKEEREGGPEHQYICHVHSRASIHQVGGSVTRDKENGSENYRHDKKLDEVLQSYHGEISGVRAKDRLGCIASLEAWVTH